MCCNASLQMFKLYRLLGGKGGGGRGGDGGWGRQKNRQQVRSQLQRSDKPVFASSQVLGRGSLNHSFGFWAPICPKLPKTYFCAPICQKNCPKPIFRHLFVQNLFWGTYLSYTTQNLFWGTYLSQNCFTPNCPKPIFGHLFVQNCPKPI